MKVAFAMVEIKERFYLTALKETVETWYSMHISRKKELGKKMLQATIKITFNIEDHTFESMQCVSYFMSFICFDTKCSDFKKTIWRAYLDKHVLPRFFYEVYTKGWIFN